MPGFGRTLHLLPEWARSWPFVLFPWLFLVFSCFRGRFWLVCSSSLLPCSFVTNWGYLLDKHSRHIRTIASHWVAQPLLSTCMPLCGYTRNMILEYLNAFSKEGPPVHEGQPPQRACARTRARAGRRAHGRAGAHVRARAGSRGRARAPVCVRIIFGPRWGHVWTMLGSYLGHVGAIFGPCLDHVWPMSMFGPGLTYMHWYIASAAMFVTLPFEYQQHYVPSCKACQALSPRG
jgi:hypothetical protein